MTKVEIIHGFTYKIEFVSNLSALSLLSRKIEVGLNGCAKYYFLQRQILLIMIKNPIWIAINRCIYIEKEVQMCE